MNANRLRKVLFAVLAGGMLLQTTTSCVDTIGPVLAQAVVGIVLNAVLGGIAT